MCIKLDHKLKYFKCERKKLQIPPMTKRLYSVINLEFQDGFFCIGLLFSVMNVFTIHVIKKKMLVTYNFGLSKIPPITLSWSNVKKYFKQRKCHSDSCRNCQVYYV